MNKFQAQLAAHEYLILDGAMGTMLMNAGLTQGAPPEEWNLMHPDRIQEIHRCYIDAGSQVILTNTFGGTRYRLKLHNLQDQAYEINKAAAEIGRAAASAAATATPVLVAGSMGPTGELLIPMGTMTFDDAKAAFAEQARGLADGGADMLWIETMSDLEEVRAAVEGARSVCDLPVVATLSFDTNGRSMMGVTAAQMVETLGPLNLAAIGANCGNNLPDTMAAVEAMHALNPDIPLIAKANAGIPRWGSSGELEYDGTPDVMAGYAYHVHEMGARLIGACCGSSPGHIQAMAAALRGETPVTRLVKPPSEEASPAAEPADRRLRRRVRRRE